MTECPRSRSAGPARSRCSVPICSLAALASAALPSRMKARAALPRPSRSRTCSRDRPVGQHQAGAGGLAGIGQPVQRRPAAARPRARRPCAATGSPARPGAAAAVSPATRYRPAPGPGDPGPRPSPPPAAGWAAAAGRPGPTPPGSAAAPPAPQARSATAWSAPRPNILVSWSSWPRGQQARRARPPAGHRYRPGPAAPRSAGPRWPPARAGPAPIQDGVSRNGPADCPPPGRGPAPPPGHRRCWRPLATWRAGRPARLAASPVPRSSRGRSPGSTQTSGSMPRPGHGQQVGGDRPLGQVEHRDLASGLQPGRADMVSMRRPAGQRPAGHVDPVHVGPERHRVPVFLLVVGGPPGLPVPGLLGVPGLPLEQPGLLQGRDLGHPAPLTGHPGPHEVLAAPDLAGGQHRAEARPPACRPRSAPD